MNAAPPFKFSNIFTSMMVNYVLTSAEGWTDMMDTYVKYIKLA